MIHARASHKNNLHSVLLTRKRVHLLVNNNANVVSHGGAVGASMDEKPPNEYLTGQPFKTKLAAAWDLDDCKSLS